MAHTAEQFTDLAQKQRSKPMSMPKPPEKPSPWPIFMGDCATPWAGSTMLLLLWRDAERLRKDTENRDGRP